MRIADDRLPRRLRIARAGPADYARNRRRTRRTTAWAAAASGYIEIGSPVAEARGAIGRRSLTLQKVNDQTACTAVVPRNLWYIGLCRPAARTVRSTPVGTGCTRIVIAEIGAAYRDVVGCRRAGIYADTAAGCRFASVSNRSLVSERGGGV